ncbi:TPA_asm: hypothetical protein [Porphyromonas phage phage018a_AFR5B1]|uniref:Uncharacterized protein n=1 Tax=Porphyromonas phage phage018a_AFR5B1 TaxID=3154108 RepID=A0AAT9JCA1_9CAUD
MHQRRKPPCPSGGRTGIEIFACVSKKGFVTAANF